MKLTAQCATSRRKFIQTGLKGLAILPLYNLAGCTPKNESIRPLLGLQLYSIRNEIEKDVRSSLKKVADIGYKRVESAFWPSSISIEEGGKLLKEYNLEVFSAHIELPVNDAEKENWLRIADAYQCDRMIWHGWPEDPRYKTEEGTLELVRMYHEANEFARSNGLRFGIHNHWWEYEKQETGKYPFEVLLENLDPSVFFEIDTYWVTVAGHDPVDIIRTFKDRAELLHIKDGPAIYSNSLDADEPDPMSALGTGKIDIPGIADASAMSARYYVVELDLVEGDVFDALRKSYDFMIDRGYAKA